MIPSYYQILKACFCHASTTKVYLTVKFSVRTQMHLLIGFSTGQAINCTKGEHTVKNNLLEQFNHIVKRNMAIITD